MYFIRKKVVRVVDWYEKWPRAVVMDSKFAETTSNIWFNIVYMMIAMWYVWFFIWDIWYPWILLSYLSLYDDCDVSTFDFLILDI